MKVRQILHPTTQEKEWVHIFTGFDTMEDLMERVPEELCVALEHMAIVQFMGMYYAVLDGGRHKRAVIGKRAWWLNTQDGTCYGHWENQQLPYAIDKLVRRYPRYNKTNDAFKSLDEEAKVYVWLRGGWKEVEYLYGETILRCVFEGFQESTHYRRR